MTKEEVLSRIDPFRVYSSYISDLEHTNGYTSLHSPLREDNKKSFAIYWDTSTWKDFSTGESGNVIDFVMKIENINFPAAIKRICEIEGIENKKTKDPAKDKKAKNITSEMMEKYIANFETGKPKALFARWEQRKINLDILRQHKIGIKQEFQKVGDPYRFFGGFIIPLSFDDKGNVTRSRIIYWDNKRSVDIVKERVKHISWNNKPGYDAIGLLGTDRPEFKSSHQVILCEGEEDYFSLISNGFVACTGLSGAGTFKKEWAEHFKDKEVVILYDNDAAGEKGSNQAAEILYPTAETVKIAAWINEKEKYDIGDFFSDGRDPKELGKMITSSKIYKPDKITQGKKQTAAQKNKEEKTKQELKEKFYFTQENGKLQLLQQTVAEYLVLNFNLCTASESERNVNWFRYFDGFWKKISPVEVENIVRSILAIEPTFSQIQAICKSARSIRHIEPSQFNNYPTLINLNNGIYDLENYEFIPHSENYFFSYKNPYNYEPEARCNYFHQALMDYSLNEITWIEAMFEIIGYCLTGTYEKQKMFWFTGSSGGNGKGTVLRVMEKLTGYALTKPGFQPAKLGGNFYKKDLIGKRLAIAGDLPPFMSNVATIKELSGGDRQSTDVKFGDSVDFVNVAKLVFAMNQMPEFPSNETIEPILRRIYLLPFKFQITDYDMGLELKFEKELPGIFNEAIAGLQRFRARGDFPVVELAQKEIKMWLGGVTTFYSYLEDRIVFDLNAYSWGDDLWTDYKKFMTNISGEDWQKEKSNIIKDKINFGRQLKKRYQDIKTLKCWNEATKKQAIKYIGIRLMDRKSDYEQKGFTINDIDEALDSGAPF
jgi:P4 family phage/plasmid primase-like protien